MQLAWGNGLISLFPMLSKTFEHVQPCIQRHQIEAQFIHLFSCIGCKEVAGQSNLLAQFELWQAPVGTC